MKVYNTKCDFTFNRLYVVKFYLFILETSTMSLWSWRNTKPVNRSDFYSKTYRSLQLLSGWIGSERTKEGKQDTNERQHVCCCSFRNKHWWGWREVGRSGPVYLSFWLDLFLFMDTDMISCASQEIHQLLTENRGTTFIHADILIPKASKLQRHNQETSRRKEKKSYQ